LANHFSTPSDPVHKTLDSRLKQFLQIISPVTIRVFSLVQDLDKESLVLKVFREILPSHQELSLSPSFRLHCDFSLKTEVSAFPISSDQYLL
jgi:hypothetical protein